MFGAIGSAISKIFGTDKALSALVEGTRDGLDKLIYTSEEKSDDAAKDRSEARKMIIAWMASTSGQNIARRLIALCVVCVWLAQFISMNVLSVISVWVAPDISMKMIESSKIIGGFADKMSGAVMLILGFYFAAPYMAGMVKGSIDKFSGK